MHTLCRVAIAQPKYIPVHTVNIPISFSDKAIQSSVSDNSLRAPAWL